MPANIIVILTEHTDHRIQELNTKILVKDNRVRDVVTFPTQAQSWGGSEKLEWIRMQRVDGKIVIVDTDDGNPNPCFLPIWAFEMGRETFFWRECRGFLITPFYTNPEKREDKSSFLLSCNEGGIGSAGLFQKRCYNTDTGEVEQIPTSRTMTEFAELTDTGKILTTKDWATIISRAIELRV